MHIDNINTQMFGLGSVDMRDELENILPVAYENGCRYFDTSDDYGSEIYVGKAISAFKEYVIVSTKLSYPAQIYSLKTYFERQKRKIGKIDIYLMHRIKPFVLQTEISPLYQQRDVVAICEKNNLQIINYSPFAHNHKKIVDDEYLKDVAKKYKQSIQNVILKWSIQKGFTPLVKTSSVSRLETMRPNNLLSFNLEKNEMEYIDSLDSNIKVWPEPKKRFSLSSKFILLIIYMLSKLHLLRVVMFLKRRKQSCTLN